MLCGGFQFPELDKDSAAAWLYQEKKREKEKASIAQQQKANAAAAEKTRSDANEQAAKTAQAKLSQAESCVSTYTNYPTHLQACLLTVLNGKSAADAYCSAATKGKNPNAACKAVADNAARQLVDQLAKQKLLK